MTISKMLGALALGLIAATLPLAAAAAPCSSDFMADKHLAPATFRECLSSALAAGSANALSTDALYDAASMLYFRGATRPDAADVASQKLLTDELDRRGALRPVERRRFFGALLANDMWDAADRYRDSARAPQSIRDIPMPQRVAMSSAPAPGDARYWTWSADAKTLTERDASLSKGVHLVITASTGCHFCPLVARDVAKDEALQKAFAERALWIARPEELLDPSDYRQWNDEHPGLPMVLVTNVRGWPMPDIWATPFFYFVVDGKVVKKMEGYEPGRLAEIKAEFAQLGVAVAD